jgi:multicomponent Na+:H+ antiporter subunit E
VIVKALLLALAWIALSGSTAPGNVLFGLALGFLVSRFVPAVRAERARWWRPGRIVALARLIGYFVWELILANLRVAVAVLGPRSRLRPAVVAVRLDLRRDVEITIFANLITLTPGTLSIDVSSDRRVLFVHTMFFDGDAEAFRQQMKQGFERRVLEALA